MVNFAPVTLGFNIYYFRITSSGTFFRLNLDCNVTLRRKETILVGKATSNQQMALVG